MALEKISISNLPQRTQLLLFTLVIFGFGLVFYYYYFQPISTELAQLQAEIDALKIEVEKGQIVLTRLPEFKETIRRQEEKLLSLRQILPEEKETAEIIRKIQEFAVESNLRIKSFTPQKTVRNDFYEDWPILIVIEGNYDNLGVFFERVGQFTRIINVDNISIKRVEKNPGKNKTIGATCTATTFVFLEGAASSSI